jgi:DNA-binding transcriptional regulator YiaG
MNTMGIYGLIIKETDEIYIGQSLDIAKRWSYYGAKFKANEHYYKELQDAYNENKDNIGWIILEECNENDNLEEREDWWIKNAPKMGYIVINKQKFGKSKSKVADTSKMKEKQTGELNGNARLKKEDIIEIKQMLKEGIKQAVIANKFRISDTHIYNISKGKRWASVEV